MPGFDRTGPRGEGSLTGWGRGRCGGRRASGADRPRLGLAHRHGWGRGGGRWGGPWDAPWAGLWRGEWFDDPKQTAWLRERKRWLEERLRGVCEELDALEKHEEDAPGS